MYKDSIIRYDTIALSQLDGSLEVLVHYADQNKLTQDLYLEEREKIKIINKFIWKSPNLRFMAYGIEELIDPINKDVFEKDKLIHCKYLHQEIESMFKQCKANGIDTFYYFKTQDHKDEFIEKCFNY